MASPHILVVDDDYNLRLLLHEILEAHYRVTTTHNGQAALDLLRQQSFDLVILDMMMPEMDGFAALKAIRAHPDTLDLPVILLSARSQNEDVVRGLENGADDYLVKPFSVDVVRARIERQVQRKRRLDDRQRVILDLKRAQEAQNRILRIATHDLKSPLTNIRLAHFYLREMFGDNPQAVTALDAIEETVNNMNELVEDFLDSSALQDGKTALELSPVNLETVLWQVMAHYAASANRKNITLLLGDGEGRACADEARLIQMISNLVSNAIKYSPPDSFVTLASQVIGDRVRVTVSDDGPGVPLDERPRLFESFSKLSNRPTGGESSTGLGLWIVRELARLHDGAAGADFPPDGGASFWVELSAAAV